VSTRLSKKYNNWNLTQEIIDDSYYITYNSAMKYDPGKKTKFSTFLANETKWAYLNKCNKHKNANQKLSALESFPVPIADEHQASIHHHNEIMNSINLIIKQNPDKRIRDIFQLRYIVGKRNGVMPWHMVGSRVGLSAQGCINLHKSGINFLKEKLKQEGIKC
jgi:DNA-directed RNA polymerase specialized sigma subunit